MIQTLITRLNAYKYKKIKNKVYFFMILSSRSTKKIIMIKPQEIDNKFFKNQEYHFN